MRERRERVELREASALNLYRVLHERIAGWCNDPARVTMEVDVQHVVADSLEAAQALSTLPAVTEVLLLGPLPDGAGVVLEVEDPPEEHSGTVVDRFGRAHAHAECSCGWEGPARTGLASRGTAAFRDLEEHYREVNRGA